LDPCGKPWKLGKEVIGGEDAVGRWQRGANGTKSVLHAGSCGVIGLPERDTAKVLDCCLDNHCFACGVGILELLAYARESFREVILDLALCGVICMN
jgi:hypothetical protein